MADRSDPAPLHAILVGDGDVPPRAALDAAWPGWADGAGLVIAADGGARKTARAGLAPDLVVGDADSLGEDGLAAVRAAGVPVELAAAAKDETDLELAVVTAVGRGATRLTILGALGGSRFDHAVANAWLLAHPALRGCEVVLIDGAARIRLLDATAGITTGPTVDPVTVGPATAGPATAGPATAGAVTVGPVTVALFGRPGDLVSLLPFGGDAIGVTTEGLAYPLRDERLVVGPARGISNVRLVAEARVSLRAGRLLIIETHVPQGGQP
jgi:thiamine pyrophosphokinase